MDYNKSGEQENTGERLEAPDFESLEKVGENSPEKHESQNKIKRPHEEAPKVEATKKCKHCGFEIKADAAFCAKCGMPTSEQDELAISEHDKPVEEQNPEIASDGHKLEKEWVEKTKEVVDKTKDDPREEEIQVGELKADYLKKRFNRAIGDKN